MSPLFRRHAKCAVRVDGAATSERPLSRQEIAEFLSLHDQYCTLLSKTSPNLAPVLRTQTTEGVVAGLGRAELERRRTELTSQIDALAQLDELESMRPYMEELGRKRREVREWAAELASFLALWARLHPELEATKQNLADARYLSDEANVNALDHDQLAATHERLKAAIADRHAHQERVSQRLASREPQRPEEQ